MRHRVRVSVRVRHWVRVRVSVRGRGRDRVSGWLCAVEGGLRVTIEPVLRFRLRLCY